MPKFQAAVLAAMLCALTAGCGAKARPARSVEALTQARRDDDAARAAASRDLIQDLVRRARWEADEHAAGRIAAAPAIDILVISGGGDWGAFGAGVLKGWGRVQGELARPEFDAVTGVSTGALIAPFAFVGDDASIERIVQLYRNPKRDWIKKRGLPGLWPSNASIFQLPGLERDIRESVDRPMLERIAVLGDTHRQMIVNTTNVDFGDMRAWDIVAEARAALENNDMARVPELLLASAAIPGVFPARAIDGDLYVDGAITGNILYGGRVRDSDALSERWRTSYPNEAVPRVRYWVIFNNQIRFPPQVTRERWPDVAARARMVATQSATVNSIRHLFALAEIDRLKRQSVIEVRVLAVPEDWTPPNAGLFDKVVMNELADLGERPGAGPVQLADGAAVMPIPR